MFDGCSAARSWLCCSAVILSAKTRRELCNQVQRLQELLVQNDSKALGRSWRGEADQQVLTESPDCFNVLELSLDLLIDFFPPVDDEESCHGCQPDSTQKSDQNRQPSMDRVQVAKEFAAVTLGARQIAECRRQLFD